MPIEFLAFNWVVVRFDWYECHGLRRKRNRATGARRLEVSCLTLNAEGV